MSQLALVLTDWLSTRILVWGHMIKLLLSLMFSCRCKFIINPERTSKPRKTLWALAFTKRYFFFLTDTCKCNKNRFFLVKLNVLSVCASTEYLPLTSQLWHNTLQVASLQSCCFLTGGCCWWIPLMSRWDNYKWHTLINQLALIPQLLGFKHDGLFLFYEEGLSLI